MIQSFQVPTMDANKEQQRAIDIPLLRPYSKILKTPAQKVVRRTFKGTANLANLLPSGTVLVFHVLSPIVTKEGQCESAITRTLALCLLVGCTVSCFLLCFTDSYRDGRGKVRYCLATFRGLIVLDTSDVDLPEDEERKFRITFVDFFHAFISVIVFAAVAMTDDNMINCFVPSPSSMVVREVLSVVPATVGVICGALFVMIPSKRHGIGFPVSRR